MAPEPSVPASLRTSPWGRRLEGEFTQPYWRALMTFVKGARGRGPVYPPCDQVFRALELVFPKQAKVVILGQDPYHGPRQDHGPRQAHGLCFSVPYGVARPDSLRNIHKELQDDCGIAPPDHGNLEAWATQGVLLLNTTLTVSGGAARSHRGKGWERFTDAVIEAVAKDSDPVFLLWGADAQEKENLIRRCSPSAAVIKSSHPSPRSAHRKCRDSPPFIGSKPFSQTNDALRKTGRGEIDWDLEVSFAR